MSCANEQRRSPLGTIQPILLGCVSPQLHPSSRPSSLGEDGLSNSWLTVVATGAGMVAIAVHRCWSESWKRAGQLPDRWHDGSLCNPLLPESQTTRSPAPSGDLLQRGDVADALAENLRYFDASKGYVVCIWDLGDPGRRRLSILSVSERLAVAPNCTVLDWSTCG